MMGKHLDAFKTPEIKFWPEIRWWLPEGFHTDQTLKNDLQQLYDSGFGGIEFAALGDSGVDPEHYGWGSEEWIHDSHLLLEEATKRGMAISFTDGAGCNFANLPTLTADDAAAAMELDYTVEIVQPGALRCGKLGHPELKNPDIHAQALIAVVAVKNDESCGDKSILCKDHWEILTDRVIGNCLEWRAPMDGSYSLFTFWLHGTGQTDFSNANQCRPINYLDKDGAMALIDYWNDQVFTGEVRPLLKENGRAQMFMDSLEVGTYGNGGILWGKSLLEMFRKRRGYDLIPYLPYILKAPGTLQWAPQYAYDCHDRMFLDKLRQDVFQTMTEGYMEHTLKPMQDWLHGLGMELRAQISYGMTYEISLPAKYVDGVETESLEFASQIESYRNLAGPAHMYHRLFSSETGAAMLNYMEGLNFYTQIIFTQFAAGVSRTILHGYSSIAGSEPSTFWPGHEGMWPLYSERFGPRQPAYRHYRDWTAMLARYQKVLRQGCSRVDLAILRLDYNFNNMIHNGDRGEKHFYENNLMRANEGLYWKDMTLQNNGYTYDYFAPQLLEEPKIRFEDGVLDPSGAGYQAVIVYQEFMPLSSARKLYLLAQQGLPVIIVNGAAETLRTTEPERCYERAANYTNGLDNHEKALRDVMGQLKSLTNVKEIYDAKDTYNTLRAMGILPRAAFTEPNRSILSTMRDDDGEKFVFLYNYMYTQKTPCQFSLSIAGQGQPFRLNCWTGDVEALGNYRHENGRTVVTLSLNPGEATLLSLDTRSGEKFHVIWANDGEYVISADHLLLKASDNKAYDILLADGGRRQIDVYEVPETVVLDRWHLMVEDWNEGEKVTITEERTGGIVTKEVYYETSKEMIEVGETSLIPWREIPVIGSDVSGVGYYTCMVELPEYWKNVSGAVLKMESTCGNTAAVYVNGQKGPAVDFDALTVDLKDMLHPGMNEIRIEVSSTLNNRLMARGYYKDMAKLSTRTTRINYEPIFTAMMGGVNPTVSDYGLTGTVKLIPYVVKKLGKV